MSLRVLTHTFSHSFPSFLLFYHRVRDQFLPLSFFILDVVHNTNPFSRFSSLFLPVPQGLETVAAVAHLLVFLAWLEGDIYISCCDIRKHISMRGLLASNMGQ